MKEGKIKMSKNTLDLSKEYFSMAEVAQILSVDKQTVRNNIQRGNIEAIKIMGVVRIHRTELTKQGIKLGE